MTRIPISAAAAALLRALIARSGVPRNRILLTDARSVDWRSLTFAGERHEIHLRVTGPDSEVAARRLCAGLEDAEFNIQGVIVADISAALSLDNAESVGITIEALTVAED